MIPNLLTASASYVVLDVKGELLDGYGNYLKEKGYRIKALNLKVMERSNQYNPFSYIRTEEDIIKLVTNLQVNTTPPDSMKGDPFWEDGLALYLMSLFYYVWMECAEEERTMNKVLELCNKEAEVLDEDGRLERKADAKGETVRRVGPLGLLLFVAIPIPGTGAWTGALIAALLRMKNRTAVPCILLGVLIAAAIVSLATFGVIHII